MPGRNGSERNMAEIKLSRWKVIGKSFFLCTVSWVFRGFVFLSVAKKSLLCRYLKFIPFHIEVTPTKHDKSKLGCSPGCTTRKT